MQVVSRALTDDGYGIGTPFKSSRIGKDVGYKALQKYYGMSKDNLKKPGALDRLRQTVKDAMSPHNTRDEFRQLLKAESINTVFRINPVGRVYGVTFIDHTNGIVANGSVLGKEFSANSFEQHFTERDSIDRVPAVPVLEAKPYPCRKSCLRSCRHVVGLGRCAGFRGTAKNPATAEKKETASIITKIEF